MKRIQLASKKEKGLHFNFLQQLECDIQKTIYLYSTECGKNASCANSVLIKNIKHLVLAGTNSFLYLVWCRLKPLVIFRK